MSDIVERLDRADDVPIFEEAAAEIRRLRAENERLRRVLKLIADDTERSDNEISDQDLARAALAQHDEANGG
jgi:hypothetical protein